MVRSIPELNRNKIIIIFFAAAAVRKKAQIHITEDTSQTD